MNHDAPLVATPVLAGDHSRLTRADELARRVARTLDLPVPRRERVSMNAVYVAGPCAIRVCRPTSDPVVAIRAARHLTERGLHVALPFHEESFVDPEVDPELGATAWHHIDIDSSREPDWSDVGRMIRELHSLTPSEMSAIHPLPLAGRFPWWEVGGTIDELATLRPLEEVRILRAALERLTWVTPHIRDAHDDHVVVHGDLHPGNVVVDARTGRSVILDWDLLARCPRGWDHAPLLRWTQRWGGRTGIYEDFASGYGTDLSQDPISRGIAELRLLVATVMRVRAATTDDSARDEADKRVGYWAGIDSRTWTAV